MQSQTQTQTQKMRFRIHCIRGLSCVPTLLCCKEHGHVTRSLNFLFKACIAILWPCVYAFMRLWGGGLIFRNQLSCGPSPREGSRTPYPSWSFPRPCVVVWAPKAPLLYRSIIYVYVLYTYPHAHLCVCVCVCHSVCIQLENVTKITELMQELLSIHLVGLFPNCYLSIAIIN
jgi:hypothetical protein